MEGKRKYITAPPNQFVLEIVTAVPKTVQIVIIIQTVFKKELKRVENKVNEIWEETKRKWRKLKEDFILALLYDSIGRVGWDKNIDDNRVFVGNLEIGSGTGPLYKYLRYESPTEVGNVTKINVLDIVEFINTEEDADVSSKLDNLKKTSTFSKPKIINKVEVMYQKRLKVIMLPKKQLTVPIIQITVNKWGNWKLCLSLALLYDSIRRVGWCNRNWKLCLSLALLYDSIRRVGWCNSNFGGKVFFENLENGIL